MARKCAHGSFLADIVVNQLEPSKELQANIKIRCAKCQMPFCFVGVPVGISFIEPTINLDATELHAPVVSKEALDRRFTLETLDPKKVIPQ